MLNFSFKLFGFLCFIAGVLMLPKTVYGQELEESKAGAFHVSPGLNYHLQINHLDVAPIVDFSITEQIHAGVGLNYLYYFRKEGYRNGESALGANVYGRYFVLSKLFVHLEYLHGRGPYHYKLFNEVRKVKENSLFLGFGYRQPFTDHIDGYAFVLADLSHSEESVYESKILFKIGVTF